MSDSVLRIGLAYTGGRGWIGGEQYVANILDSLVAYRSSQHQTLSYELTLCYFNRDDDIRIRKTFAQADHFRCLETQTSPRRRRDVALESINLYIPRKLRIFQAQQQRRWIDTTNIDVIYPFDFSSSITANTKAIGWIPDFQPRLFPHYFSEYDLKQRMALDERIISSASDIVFSSEDCLQQFNSFYPNYKGRPHLFHFHHSVPSHLSSANPYAIQSKYNLPDKFFICCNQFWQHKNHAFVFEALGTLKKIYPDLFVVFTGHTQDSRLSGHFDELCALVSRLDIRSNIAILGLIPRSDQLQLIRRSIGIIQPSLSEGWSSVVEDARALGKRCVLSNLTVHQEQQPPKAVYFDRTSLDSLCTVVSQAWHTWDEGPDLVAEDAAQQLSVKLIDSMAAKFISIVAEAAEKQDSQSGSLTSNA